MALLFWGRSRLSFPFLLNSFQRDLGSSPSAFSCLGDDLEVGEEHLNLCSSFNLNATCKSGDALGPWCGTWVFTSAKKTLWQSLLLVILLEKPSTPRPAETPLGPHSPWDTWVELTEHFYNHLRRAISDLNLKGSCLRGWFRLGGFFC